MKAFSRVSKYILPQWPRITIVVASAAIVSVLLSLSFLTVIPLLKVMIGQEGLGGWLDRKICNLRYGVTFYVPEGVDFSRHDAAEIVNNLLVTRVDEDGPAGRAGLMDGDRIVGIADRDAEAPMPFTEMLREMADANQQTRLIVRREEATGAREMVIALEGAKTGGLRGRAVALAQFAAGFVPPEQNADNKEKAIIVIIAAIGVITVIRCTAKFYQEYLGEKVVHVTISRLREDAFGRIMNMPVAYFSHERPSDSVSRLIRDTGAMATGIKTLLGKALREPMNVMAFLAGAALLDWKLTLVFLCGAPPTVGLVGLLGRRMKRASKKSLMVWSQMLAKLQEIMAGLKVVKVYNRQQQEQGSFRQINRSLLRQLLRISKIDAATNPIMEMLGMAAGSAALVFGAAWVTHGDMEGSYFLVLLGLLGGAAESVRKISDVWNKVQEANGAAERVFAMMDVPAEVEKTGACVLGRLKDRIEFRNVVFTYPGSQRPALNGVNLAIKAGHNIAIVGPNGSGKTTLANLIARFYDPDSGQILIDGQEIRDATIYSLRDQIAMVTQNVVTFNDTIAANIAYGKSGASREEIIAAAKRAYAHEFIEPLPKGYDTVIGEQGSGLSGGQLQRIVIARAILKNPAILIFDEATSQVDADSEAKIHEAIEEIMRDRTSFIIAHRFSTIIAADVIVVMDDGRIVAQGKHEQLIKSCQLYRRLYETQLVQV